MADVGPPIPAPETTETIVQGIRERTSPLLNYFDNLSEVVSRQLLSASGLKQLLVVVAAGTLAWLVARSLRGFVDRTWLARVPVTGSHRQATLAGLIFPVLWVLALWTASAIFDQNEAGNELLRLSASLLNAWILIRLVSSLVASRAWSRAFALIAWTVAALNILHLLNPTIALLDGIGIQIGDTRLSLYLIAKGGVLAFLYVGIANVVSDQVRIRLGRKGHVGSSASNLVAQAARILLLIFAVVLALREIGVDLTALAVFSGAVGIGIGFGLQAVSSNLIAGVIMLVERSVRVGDFVDMQSGVTGEVREISIRSTRITTNDNIDVLIPNAEFISGRVTNWTLHDAFRRIRIPFGVAYGTDKELVRKAALEAASRVPHMLVGLQGYDPQVWLVGFGDSSLNFELVVWLKPDAVKRPGAVQADYNWALETALQRHGIEIPFPQRDIHIRSGGPSTLATEAGPAPAGAREDRTRP